MDLKEVAKRVAKEETEQIIAGIQKKEDDIQIFQKVQKRNSKTEF